MCARVAQAGVIAVTERELQARITTGIPVVEFALARVVSSVAIALRKRRITPAALRLRLQNSLRSGLWPLRERRARERGCDQRKRGRDGQVSEFHKASLSPMGF